MDALCIIFEPDRDSAGAGGVSVRGHGDADGRSFRDGGNVPRRGFGGSVKVFPDPIGKNRGAAREPGDHRAAGIVENWGVLCAGGDSGVGRKTQESRELRKM